MRFSVIVPFRNEERYIEQCISALLSQDYDLSNCEFIFIDNGSSDSSSRIARKHKELRHLELATPDPYLARNLAATEAKGKYLIFLDADCAPETNWLSAYASALDNNSAKILLGKICYPKEASRLLQCHEDYYDTKTFLAQNSLPRECAYGHAGNMLIEKNLFTELGMFDAMPVPGDTEIVQLYLNSDPSAKLRYVPDAVVCHLEVRTLLDFLKKQKSYGALSDHYQKKSNYRVLSFRERLQVFRECLSRHNYGFQKSALLLISLIFGVLAFELGRTIGIFKRINVKKNHISMEKTVKYGKRST